MGVTSLIAILAFSLLDQSTSQTTNKCTGEWTPGNGCGSYNCKVIWTYDPTAEDVEFIMQATAGSKSMWLGLGFSEDQLMPSSDIVMGYYQGVGLFNLTDRYASQYAQPTVDSSQDITPTVQSIGNGVTKIGFKRKRNTSDVNQDIAFTNNKCLYLLFAIGELDTPGSVSTGFYKHHSRFPSDVKICLKSTCADEPDHKFNCHRPGQDCVEGTCGSVGGCDCTSTSKAGLRCEYLAAQHTDCPSKKCENGGVCVTNNGAAFCSCTSGYYDDTCNETRYSVICTDTRMLIHIVPNGNFGGAMYIKGGEQKEACKLRSSNLDADMPSEWPPYYIGIDHTSSECGNADNKTEGLVTTYSRSVVVWYSINIINSLDEHTLVKCTYNSSADSQVTAEISSIPYDVNNLQGGETGNTFSPQLTLTAATSEGAVGSNAVAIGKELIFTLTAPSGRVYVGIKLLSFVANNGMSGADLKKMDIITASCVKKAASAIRPEAPTGNGQLTVVWKLRAFKFIGNSSKVLFIATVRICLDAVNCNQETCSGTGRRKRNIDVEKTEVVKTTVNVVDPLNPSPTAELEETDKPKDCPVNKDMMKTGIMAAMGVVIVLLLVVILVILLCRCRAEKEKYDKKLPPVDYPQH